MSAFDPKRTLDKQLRQWAAPTALNFGVLKSISVTKTYGESFEHLVSQIWNGLSTTTKMIARMIAATQANTNGFMMTDSPFGSNIRLYSFLFPTGLTRQLVSTIAKHSSPVSATREHVFR